MDKYLLIFLILLVVYLNRSYALLFDYSNEKALTAPSTQTTFTLVNPEGSGSAKYVSLGDSLTAGVGSNDYHTTLPFLYSQSLNQKYKQVTLVNLAKPGAKIRQILSEQVPAAIKEKPDIVSVLIGTNDLRSLGQLDEFTDTYYKMGKMLADQTSAELVFINLPLLGASQITYPPYNWILDYRTRQYNEIIKEAAAAFGARYVDLYTPSVYFSENEAGYYSSDLFHPSAKGYILWSKLLNAD